MILIINEKLISVKELAYLIRTTIYKKKYCFMFLITNKDKFKLFFHNYIELIIYIFFFSRYIILLFLFLLCQHQFVNIILIIHLHLNYKFSQCYYFFLITLFSFVLSSYFHNEISLIIIMRLDVSCVRYIFLGNVN